MNNMRITFGCLAATSLVVAALSMGAWGAEAPRLPAPANRPVDFAKEVEPILAENCYSCHGPRKQESGLRLDQKSPALAGGETFGTNAIIAGRSADSI